MLGCGQQRSESKPKSVRPNILWIVWDTARADHLSLYGYGKPTTPFLEEWARDARVYEDCVSTAPYTVPSHASMFTGLLPTEHGADNARSYLDDRHQTLAEILRAQGYQTYLYSANPHISRAGNFHRGFDVEEHPWDPQYREEALRIVTAKILPEDQSSELAVKIRAQRPNSGWDIKASGELAARGALAWLDRRDPQRPFFVFLNYMEAHRPWIPPAAFRREIMTPAEVARSYRIDRSWLPLWSYTFRLHEYTEEELGIMATTYDTCLRELDELLRGLFESLQAKGLLDHTVVVLTSDHGEHLGEHHILDHQYSLYEPVLRIPLIIRDPERFAPGRDLRPVTNLDLFPTLLELAGAEVPAGSRGLSLLGPPSDRVRLAEYLGPFKDPFPAIVPQHPGWDRSPWEREIRALYAGSTKLIRWSDGRTELYRLQDDPDERFDLSARAPDEAKEMEATLEAFSSALRPGGERDRPPVAMSHEQRELLRSLGYIHGGESDSISRSPEERAR